MPDVTTFLMGYRCKVEGSSDECNWCGLDSKTFWCLATDLLVKQRGIVGRLDDSVDCDAAYTHAD